MDDFYKFIDEKIFPELESIEAKRKKSIEAIRKKIVSMLCVIPVFIIIFFIIGIVTVTYITNIIVASTIGGIIFVVYLIIFVVYCCIIKSIIKKYEKYISEFSSVIIGNIAKSIDNNLEYARNSHITPSEYKASGLFLTRYDRFDGKDLVYGKLDKTEIKFSYLSTYHNEIKANIAKIVEHPIFDGLFFIADFNKRFSGEVYLIPHIPGLGFFFHSPRSGTKKILLENHNFNRKFDVYGSDPVVTMYTISTSFVDRLLNFSRETYPMLFTRMSLINSTLYLAIWGKYKPEVPVRGTVFNKKICYDYLKQLKFATGIVEELNLNTRIWTQTPPNSQASTSTNPITSMDSSSSIKFCPKCNYNVEPADTFCSNCGQLLK